MKKPHHPKSSALDALLIQYEGHPIRFRSDGWFNATLAAKRYRKKPYEWLRLPDTLAYLEALGRQHPATAQKVSKAGKSRLAHFLSKPEFLQFVAIRQGGRTDESGTWLHPKLAVRFAQWLNMDFAVWCDMQIDHILRGGLSLLSKEFSQRSETPDRERLLTTAAAIVARHRLPFGTVYEALNLFAGVACARDMSCAQVSNTAAFGERLLSGTATPADFARIDQHRAASHGPAPQLALPDGTRI